MGRSLSKYTFFMYARQGLGTGDMQQVLGTRYSVLGTRYSVLGTRYSVLGTREEIYASISTVSRWRSMIKLQKAKQFSVGKTDKTGLIGGICHKMPQS
jgi:hypothetical protein